MRKIRKLINLIICLLVFTFSFSFKLSELEFGETVQKGLKKSKSYTLTNNNKVNKLYTISAQGDKNIKISPNALNLKPLDSRKFTIEVTGKGKVGEHEYFLIVKDVNKEKSKEGVDLNKIVRIKQKYTIK